MDDSIFILKNVNAIFNKLAAEHEDRLKLTKDMVIRLETILNVNNISRELLNFMNIFYPFPNHTSFQADNNHYKCVIDFHYGTEKIPPYLLFTMTNTITKKKVQQKFDLYKAENKLPTAFILLFRNTFADYFIV